MLVSLVWLLTAPPAPRPAAQPAPRSAARSAAQPAAQPAKSRPAAPRSPSPSQAFIPYDGDFTFTRIRYGSGGRGFRGFGGDAWAHDYPAADLNMGAILEDLTAVRPNTGDTNVFDLEDPTIFQNPLLYMSEPGFWRITEEGAKNLREHLLKGGFIIFDDFEADQWYPFREQMAIALPEYELIEIDGTHPVFGSFFTVDDIYVPHPLVRVTPKYFAMFEDNDPTKRMMALVNYNSDLAEYWESPRGRFMVDPTNDAFRLGVNYIIYALTH